MAIFEMCKGRKCPFRDGCWRYVNPDKDYLQEYADFDKHRKGTNICSFIILRVLPHKIKKWQEWTGR